MEKTGSRGLKRQREQKSPRPGAAENSISVKKKKKVKPIGNPVDEKPVTAEIPVENGNAKVESKTKRRKKKNKKKAKVHVAALPVKPDDISSNWKNLLKTLDAEKPTKKKNPIVFFNQNRRKKFLEAKAYSGKTQGPVTMEAEPKKKKPEIWFDDVDETLLDPEDRPNFPANGSDPSQDLGVNAADSALVKEKAFKG